MLLVISNWSSLKNSETRTERECNCEMVCVLKLLVERNKDICTYSWFWQRMGDTDCLVGIEYYFFFLIKTIIHLFGFADSNFQLHHLISFIREISCKVFCIN